MRDLLTFFLPLYFLVFFGGAFVWRSWRTKQLAGINPYRLPNNPGVEQVTGRWFRVMPLLSLLACGVYLLSPQCYALLAPLHWLEQPLLQWTGGFLMCVALAIILLAQRQMGASWRIGVDHEHPTEFVRVGLFACSRNPVFLGIMLSVTGFFLLLPNALTLVVLMLNLAMIQVQIRVEEDFLARTHGEAYARYCAQVRRWL